MSAYSFDAFVKAEPWRKRAACQGMDTALFYPSAGPGGAEERTAAGRRALAVCARCEVRPECLASAFEYDDGWAILGGTTPGWRTAFGPDRQDDLLAFAKNYARDMGLAA